MPKPKKAADRATKYAEDVTAGRIVAGPLVRKACQRHLDDLARWGTAQDGGHAYWWDVASADRVIRFFESELVLADMLDADGDALPFTVQGWQAFILGNLFGWRKADGHRRFRTAYIETGKGSGKTPLGAGIALYCLVADGQAYPEVYSAAVSQKQASITWTDARRMVDGSPRLQKQIEATAHTLKGRARGGAFSAISSEYRGLEGKRPHLAVIDELHEHPNAQVTTKMRRGTKRDKDAIILELTNAGYDRESICYQHHEFSVRVLERIVENETWFAYVCALDEGDDYRDRKVWPKANPNIGITIDESYLAEAVAEAEGMPASEADVMRLNFCIWVERKSNFIPAAVWAACALETPPSLTGIQPCGAIDLGMTDDLSAYALVWRLEEERYYARVWYWVAEGITKKHKQLPWRVWEKNSRLTITDGDVTDFLRVRDDITNISREYGVKRIGYDKQFAAQMAQELQGMAFEMIDTLQGFALNEPIRKMAALLKEGGYQHEGDPHTTWQASNVSVITGSKGEQRILRQTDPKKAEKNDGMVAQVMALKLAVLQPVPELHVYERNEVLVL